MAMAHWKHKFPRITLFIILETTNHGMWYLPQDFVYKMKFKGCLIRKKKTEKIKIKTHKQFFSNCNGYNENRRVSNRIIDQSQSYIIMLWM